ncbi:MAG: GNAT family N-acetyltransferase [bacterium]
MLQDQEVLEEMMNKGVNNILPSPQTRRLVDRRLIWPAVDEEIAGGFRLRDLDWASPREIEEVARLHREAFPELFGSVYEDILFPSRWSRWAEQWRIYRITEGEQQAATCFLTPSVQNMAVELSVLITDPAFRGRGIARQFTRAMDRLISESGAECGTVLCATFHIATQKIIEELGFERIGELRGYVLANAGLGRYARDNVVMYAKMYNEAWTLCPSEERLTRPG